MTENDLQWIFNKAEEVLIRTRHSTVREKIARSYAKKEAKRLKSMGEKVDELLISSIEIAVLDGISLGMEEERKLQIKIQKRLTIQRNKDRIY